jgi:hypothetical protein
MKARVKPAWQLSDAERQEILSLLGLVPEGADEHDPALIALLNAWQRIRDRAWTEGHAEADSPRRVPAAACYGGQWLIWSPERVCDAIRRNLEAA